VTISRVPENLPNTDQKFKGDKAYIGEEQIILHIKTEKSGINFVSKLENKKSLLPEFFCRACNQINKIVFRVAQEKISVRIQLVG